MRFLSVAEMELRAAARQPRLFRGRWLTALAFFAVLVWLMWVLDGFRNRNVGPEAFQALSVLAFVYCLLMGTASTADSLSAEKRDGTLGLLFLTNLNAAEIVAGKFLSRALWTVYGLMAIFPMLGLLLLLGGITFEQFWRTVLALLNAIAFSMATGFVASAVCVRQFTAIALATVLALAIGGGLLGVAAIIDASRGPRVWVDILTTLCPLYSVVAADDGRIFGRNHYWWSVLLVAGMSLLALLAVAWWVARTWRDRPKVAGRWRRANAPAAGGRLESVSSKTWRRRMLDWNPLFWLAGRRRISSPVMMLLAVGIVGLTVGVTYPLLDRHSNIGKSEPLLALLLACVWSGLALHALVLYYAAMVASQRVAEDKQTGALELILSTPVTDRLFSRGLWWAYARRLLFPASAAVLFHLMFIWIVAVAVTADPPSDDLKSPAQVLVRAVLNLPSADGRTEWELVIIFRVLLYSLGLFCCSWVTLGWVGRWLGMKLKHPGFAPLTALALLLIPPILEFSLLLYVIDKLSLYRLPERVIIPAVMWSALAIGVLHCVLLARWARRRLHRDFRRVVTERFQPPSLERWWRPGWKPVRRLAIRTALSLTALALLVLGFYQYQNWKHRRTWIAYQKQFQQRGQALTFDLTWPEAVPDGENFAQAPAFTNAGATVRGKGAFLGALPQLESVGLNNVNKSLPFATQQRTAFADADPWLSPVPAYGTRLTSEERASRLLAGLQPQESTLHAIAEAARRPYFRLRTTSNLVDLLPQRWRELDALEQLQFLFQVRASAWLRTNQTAAAAADIRTSLHLARLARQSPDLMSSQRAQVMVVGSLQPLWEGLFDQRWDAAQLAAFQQELAQIPLLSDHTNAVTRAVHALIASWLSIPGTGTNYLAALNPYSNRPGWDAQPGGWWFDRCIRLHAAGQAAVGRVDVVAQLVRLEPELDWSTLQELPIDGEVHQLVLQYHYYGPVPSQVAFAQTVVNQAIVACALERFHQAERSYPATLGVLVPRYLERIPNDIVRGEPLEYERAEDGRYCLRAVGPNQIDDRGKPSSDDWRWAYSTNQPALKRARQ